MKEKFKYFKYGSVFLKILWGQVKLEGPINVFLSLAMIFITFFAFYPQLNLIKKQLQEFNAKAVILVNMVIDQQVVDLGPDFSGQTDIIISAVNQGDAIPAAWRVALIFCKDIEVLKEDPSWTKIIHGNKQFALQSEKILVSRSDLSFFNSKLDSFGNFRIIFPTKNLQNGVPIALVSSSGQNTVSNFSLITLKENNQRALEFNPEPIIINNEDNMSALNIKECFDMVNK